MLCVLYNNLREYLKNIQKHSIEMRWYHCSFEIYAECVILALSNQNKGVEQ